MLTNYICGTCVLVSSLSIFIHSVRCTMNAVGNPTAIGIAMVYAPLGCMGGVLLYTAPPIKFTDLKHNPEVTFTAVLCTAIGLSIPFMELPSQQYRALL